MSEDVTRSLDLMRLAQGGDREALDRLLGRYYDRVRPIVRARLGARLRRRVDSGDILQETFAAAVRTYQRFEVRDEASLISWLARIAERQIHDEYDRQVAQKRSVTREVALDAGAGELAKEVEMSAPTAPVPDTLIRKEEACVLEDCLGELPEELRELILLRDYAGYAWDDVAERTGHPSASAARMKHARARIELGKLVQARMSGP